MEVRIEEIQRLHADCSWSIDSRAAAEYAEFFGLDAVLRIEPAGREIAGREALERFAAESPAGVHLCGPVSLRPDGTTRTAFVFTNEATGGVLSGYYADSYSRDGSGRLVFASREVRMTAPRTQDRAGDE